MPDSIGSALSSLGTMAPSFLGGGPGGWMSSAGSYLNPAAMGTSMGAPTAMDAGTGTPGGIPSTLPTDTPPSAPMMESSIGPSAPAPLSSSGGGMAAPAPGALGPSDTSAATWGAPAPVGGPGTGGTPADPGFWHSLFFGSPATGTPAAAGKPTTGPAAGGWPGIFSAKGLEGGAAVTTDLLKYLQQRAMLDPRSLMKNVQAINQANAARLKREIFPQLAAQGQETGQINAPYLMNQAYTTAIGPTLNQMNEDAMNQWLQANQIAAGMYPGGASGQSALGGFVSPSIFGGGASS